MTFSSEDKEDTNLEIEMYDVVLVEVLHPADYLPHEQTAVGLSQVEVVGSDSLEELPAVQVLHHQDDFTRRLKRIYKP